MPKRTTTNMPTEEIRKRAYELRKQLTGSIKEVRALSRTSPTISTAAMKAMGKVNTRLRNKAIRFQSRRELITTLRMLEYVAGLKSSTASGVEEMSFRFQPFKNKLSKLSKQQRDDFWEVYDKVYNNSRTTAEFFKYEIFTEQASDIIINNLKAGKSTQSIFEKIIKAIHETRLESEIEHEQRLREVFDGITKGRNRSSLSFAEQVRAIREEHASREMSESERQLILFSEKFQEILR